MPLPTVEDFTVSETPQEDLDGFSAWDTFGGLSVDEAYARLCECPERHQECFMWMGDRAFVFYFPVVDRYIRVEEPKREFDGETYILAHDIGAHFPGRILEVQALESRLSSLCDFVLDSVRVLEERDERSHSLHEVASAWRELRARIGRSHAGRGQ